jgi:hypothetical protein
MDVDMPEVLAEFMPVFWAYEDALLRHDVAALNAFFWPSASVLRYGITEHSQGIAALMAYRASAAPVNPQRQLLRTQINTFGHTFATANTEFTAPDSTLIGRQSQSWVKMDGRWLISSAHVSLIDPAFLETKADLQHILPL